MSTGAMLKLTVLGDGGVGKTALVIQLCLNKFVETYDPTIEDSYRKRLVLDEHALTLELMDTAGQEEYVSLRDQWIHEGEGFLLVYSVTQKLSFSRIQQYYDEIVRIKDEEPFGIVLVGNKIDQKCDREVSFAEGETLAASWGIPFFETSAKMNINTEFAFTELARLTRDKRDNSNAIGLGGDATGVAAATVGGSHLGSRPGSLPGSRPGSHSGSHPGSHPGSLAPPGGAPTATSIGSPVSENSWIVPGQQSPNLHHTSSFTTNSFIPDMNPTHPDQFNQVNQQPINNLLPSNANNSQLPGRPGALNTTTKPSARPATNTIKPKKGKKSKCLVM